MKTITGIGMKKLELMKNSKFENCFLFIYIHACQVAQTQGIFIDGVMTNSFVKKVDLLERKIKRQKDQNQGQLQFVRHGEATVDTKAQGGN